MEYAIAIITSVIIVAATPHQNSGIYIFLHPLLSATSGSRHGHAVVIPFLHCTAALSRLTSSGVSWRSFTAMAIFIVSCLIAMRGPSGTRTPDRPVMSRML